MDQDEVGMLVFWYDGYFSAKTKNNVLDTSALEKSMEALGEHCAKIPTITC